MLETNGLTRYSSAPASTADFIPPPRGTRAESQAESQAEHQAGAHA
jgi:hypothetical protein